MTSFCSQLARSHDVSPAGTATEAEHWLLVEDPSPWGAYAVEEADWFSRVQETIAAWKDHVPNLRVQLIRRELTTWDTPGQIRCLAVRAGPRPVVRRWALDAYDEVAELNVPGTLRSTTRVDAAPLILTCVNGRRDACCAKWGRPVAQAAAEAAPDATWQTSHLGGHRFAPTALVLPHGTHYGWLRPDDMADLIAAHRQGRLHDLDRVRGQVHQSRPVQAACLAFRQRLGRHEVDAVRGTVVGRSEEHWAVRVEDGGHTRRAHVRHQERSVAFPHSCGSDETKPDVAWAVTWDDEGPLG